MEQAQSKGALVARYLKRKAEVTDADHREFQEYLNQKAQRNLQADAKVSLMIDSRDPAASRGINIAGSGQILVGDSSRKRNADVHRKYMSAAALADSRVGPVFAGWDDVTIQITPASVIAWDMRVADRQFFGGALESNPTYLLPLER